MAKARRGVGSPSWASETPKRKPPATANRLPRCRLLLAMTNLRTHPSLLPPHLTPAFARFLRTHLVVSPLVDCSVSFFHEARGKKAPPPRRCHRRRNAQGTTTPVRDKVNHGPRFGVSRPAIAIRPSRRNAVSRPLTRRRGHKRQAPTQRSPRESGTRGWRRCAGCNARPAPGKGSGRGAEELATTRTPTASANS